MVYQCSSNSNLESVNSQIVLEGMRAIFGRNAHVARRIIWIFILITCFSIAVLQVRLYFILVLVLYTQLIYP